ncbi:Isoamylase protein-like protein [Desulfamplus magnetovallimortis]|uniref:Isoamylase protein-like protein n=1 Tax=Desulfamplus magnetovallimortis TaxID=1246637 RepID=A0A1W1HIP6_9BACT|nr:isoamylase early set domain-containing protein [Desulfamplus magnetovallimortis]SLM32316.1 Isoamylase protein-like protein [Desulfamplus magnetovallimortis]
MSITKRYLKSKPICKTKFTISSSEAGDAEKAFLSGDFNGWDISSLPMQKLKNGDFTITIDLDCGREYHFKYLMDGIKWQNDPDADDYRPSPYLDSDNCIVIIDRS